MLKYNMATAKNDQVALMSINATKAGMEGLDKGAINAIIEEASKGSKFYEAKAKAQKRIDGKKSAMSQKLETLGDEAISVAEVKADKIIQEIELTERDSTQVIVHVDMDMYYAAVEEKDDPTLKNCPMAVGSMGMLSTSNYLARKFGVRAGMPGFIGKKLCPQLKIVPPNFDKYRAVSAQVREVFKEYDPNFCPMSLDEAYLNITDYLLQYPTLKPGDVVFEMRAKIQERTQLTASAGIASNTMIAKICSDQNKPNGQFELLDEEKARDFVSSLPVRKVGGIGNVTEQLLQVIGVEKCEDIIRKRGSLFLLFSEQSCYGFFRIALGIGGTDVADMANRERKSMSSETTFKDTSDTHKLRDICKELCAELASDLQGESLYGRQVTVKIKTHKFAIKTKVSNLLQASNDADIIYQEAAKILQKFVESCEEKPLTLRLLGVRMSELEAATNSSSTAQGEQQRSIKNFLSKESLQQQQQQSFECPLCGVIVQARTEAAFINTHFEKCSKTMSEASITSSCELHAAGETPSSEESSSFLPNSSRQKDSLLRREESVVEGPEGNKTVCPICNKVQYLNDDEDINTHIDLCLNKQAIVDFTSNEKKRKLISPSAPTDNSKKTKANQHHHSIKSYFTSLT